MISKTCSAISGQCFTARQRVLFGQRFNLATSAGILLYLPSVEVGNLWKLQKKKTQTQTSRTRLYGHIRPIVRRVTSSLFFVVLSKTWTHLLFSQTLLSFKKTNRRSGKSAADSRLILCWTEHIVNTSAVTSQLASLPNPPTVMCAWGPIKHHRSSTISISPFFQLPIVQNPLRFRPSSECFSDSPVNFLPTARLSLPMACFTGAVDSFVSFGNV